MGYGGHKVVPTLLGYQMNEEGHGQHARAQFRIRRFDVTDGSIVPFADIVVTKCVPNLLLH